MNDREAHWQRLTIAPVTKERMEAACKQINLTDPMAIRALEICLKHIEADLANYSRTSYAPSERQDIVSHRRKLLGALARLEEALDENSDLLPEVLPKAALQEIGLLMAPEAIRDVLGTHSPSYLNVGDREAAYKAVGIEYGHLLIRHFVRRIRQPQDDWMAANNQNAGGRPADIRRRYVIRQLAASAPDILRQPPTASTSSPFQQLCAAVFHAFDLPVDGIEDAVERELRDLSSATPAKSDAG
jgi:hypothetical protein